MRCALLHGFAGTPAAWHDVIEHWQLPDPPRTVALPGHGGGPVQPTWDQNLDAVAAALGNTDVVVGYSLGARIALGLVAARKVERAVLVGVNPGIDDSERPARRAADAEWARMLREHGLAAFEQAWAAQPLFATQSRAPADRLAARRSARLALDAEQLAQSLETMGLAAMPDYRPQLASLARQVVLIVGGGDTKFRALAAGTGLPTLEIADSGHDVTLEQPALLARTLAHAVVRLA